VTAVRLLFDEDADTWAATEGWLLVTRDVHTMTAEHAAFVEGGQGSSGVVFIPHDVPLGRAIADLILICEASTVADWGNRTDFLPL
jgi:hypothetical protein